MKSARVLITSLLFISAAQPAAAESAAEKGLRIANEADAKNSGYGAYRAQGAMVLTTKSKASSTRRFNFKSKESGRSGNKSILVFNWPGDIRDTALLTHSFSARDDNQWLYLPAVRRVKRIVSTSRSGSFVGSEFAFEDMIDQEVAKFDYKWIKDAKCPGGRSTCYIIDRFPKYKSGYSKQRVWLDKKYLRIQQVYYYNRGGRHLKTMKLTGYKRYRKKFWRASKSEMRNHLTGKKTDLNWSKFRFGIRLPDSAFSVSALKNLR